MVDVIFGLLATGDVTEASEIIQPKNILNYLKALEADEETRKKLSGILQSLLEAAKKARQEMSRKALKSGE